MVFLDPVFSRFDTNTMINFIWKFLPSVRSKNLCEFFSCQFMSYSFYRKPFRSASRLPTVFFFLAGNCEEFVNAASHTHLREKSPLSSLLAKEDSFMEMYRATALQRGNSFPSGAWHFLRFTGGVTCFCTRFS